MLLGRQAAKQQTVLCQWIRAASVVHATSYGQLTFMVKKMIPTTTRTATTTTTMMMMTTTTTATTRTTLIFLQLLSV